MGNIYINNNYSSNDASIIGANINFNYLGEKVYSATRVDRAYGIFISNILFANEYFVRWSNISWIGEKDSCSKVNLFIRTSNSEMGIYETQWVGPYSNFKNDISLAEGAYLQFMVVLKNDTGASAFPIVNSINVSFLSLNNPVSFFTKSFNIGFVPKHLLLTYNATNENDDSIIRFAISGKNTANLNEYIYINPNQIENLEKLGFDSNSIKIMLELGGVSGTNVSVDEFAVTFGGDGEIRLNEIYNVSSSSSSSI